MKHTLLLVAGVLLACATAMPAAGQDERTPLSRSRAFKAERLAARPQAAAPAVAAKTVAVNCAKRDSISDALAKHTKNTEPLVIELRGICRENVLIERNDVTLRGADPASDGIQGVTADPQPAALSLLYVQRILLENMLVADGPSVGVSAAFSGLEMRNCRIARNGGTGIHITASSVLTGTELVVSQNTGAGINSQRQGWVTCLGCRLADNALAATSLKGGFMTLWDTEVSGRQGILAAEAGSYVDVDCVTVISTYPCSVNVQRNAAQAPRGGQASLLGVGAFTGAVSASEGGWVGVYGGEQTLPVGIIANQISDSARLTAGMAEDSGPATKLARTHLSIFARAALYDATELLGTLTCDSGADAWSDTPYPAATVSTCKNVPTTP